MSTDISATEAVRKFSDLLNNIKYRGSRYTIIRGGKSIADLIPVEITPLGRTLGELRDIFRILPRLDPDDSSFVDDLLANAKSQPSLLETTVWE